MAEFNFIRKSNISSRISNGKLKRLRVKTKLEHLQLNYPIRMTLYLSIFAKVKCVDLICAWLYRKVAFYLTFFSASLYKYFVFILLDKYVRKYLLIRTSSPSWFWVLYSVRFFNLKILR